jgi:hypothetical protein
MDLETNQNETLAIIIVGAALASSAWAADLTVAIEEGGTGPLGQWYLDYEMRKHIRHLDTGNQRGQGSRHTTHIYRDLPGLVARAVAQLGDHWGNQERRFEAYRGHELTSVQAHDLMIRALDVRAVTATQIPHILKEWRYPSHAEFAVDHSAWRLFDAVAEVAKDSNLWALAPRTQALHGLLDQECGVTFSRN